MIPRAEVMKHLFKIYRGVLLASTQLDYEFLSEYCEAEFCKKLKEWLEEIKLKNYSLELVEDMEANKGIRMLPEMNLYDSIIIKGIKAERELNMPESSYSVYNDIDHMGFISYIPNYLSDPKNFINKEETEKLLDEEFKTVKTLFIFRSSIELTALSNQAISCFSEMKKAKTSLNMVKAILTTIPWFSRQ